MELSLQVYSFRNDPARFVSVNHEIGRLYTRAGFQVQTLSYLATRAPCDVSALKYGLESLVLTQRMVLCQYRTSGTKRKLSHMRILEQRSEHRGKACHYLRLALARAEEGGSTKPGTRPR
eukprot:3452104-Rhodomonas_salina.2